MKSLLAKYSSIIVLIICLILICGCLGNGSNSLSSNKYVAVEEYMMTNCTLIEGNLSPSWMPHITLPMLFNYDGSVNGSNWADGSSWGGDHPNHYYPAINDSFKVLYGTIYYRDIEPLDTSTG